MPSEIQDILDRVKNYLSLANLARIEEAYQFAKMAHEGQLRFSGEPYLNHPVAATRHLLALQPDENTIIACLLHDVIEDTETDLATLEKKFGKVVARLTADMEKLGKVRFRGQERAIENLRKMFIAMARDLRVIFIKLADRLHNMQTLEHVRQDKQQRIARETLEVYAPIAARLGIYEFKWQLEELAFRYIYPNEYERVKREVAGTEESRQKFIASAAEELTQLLHTNQIQAEVTGRTKHLYSIWRKLEKKGAESVQEIFDLFALRVLVRTKAECYTALGVIHGRFTPLSHRFKDYIAVPKINGYQSLHTTVIGLDKSKHAQPTEVQIRTYEMHAEAERGAAAHWEYSENKQSVKIDEKKLQWVKGLVELHAKFKNNEEFVESLAIDTFSDRIFILTPKGDVLDLPAGATAIDFAYAVHTNIGHTCTGAKVNGRIAPLDQHLKNGDVIEILTKKDGKPNRFWLSFIKTESAKSKIKAYFNTLTRTENITAGKELLNRHLARLGQTKLDAESSILKNYQRKNFELKERESLLERIGNGSIAVATVVKDLFELTEISAKTSPEKLPATLTTLEKSDEVIVAGEKGLLTTFAKCCNPHPGQAIAALVSNKKGASIHRADCKQLARSDPERRLVASWKSETSTLGLVKILVGGKNRVGFLRDIATVIAGINVNIADIRLQKSDKYLIGHELTLEVSTLTELEEVLERLEQIPGVTEVARVREI